MEFINNINEFESIPKIFEKLKKETKMKIVGYWKGNYYSDIEMQVASYDDNGKLVLSDCFICNNIIYYMITDEEYNNLEDYEKEEFDNGREEFEKELNDFIRMLAHRTNNVLYYTQNTQFQKENIERDESDKKDEKDSFEYANASAEHIKRYAIKEDDFNYIICDEYEYNGKMYTYYNELGNLLEYFITCLKYGLDKYDAKAPAAKHKKEIKIDTETDLRELHQMNIFEVIGVM